MNAHDLDLDKLKPMDLNTEAAKKGSTATPFSTLIFAVADGDMATIADQLADDITWGLMPYNKQLIGKSEVLPWFKTAIADHKEPMTITNALCGDWGVYEYWNIGTMSEEVIKFGDEQHWPWPRDPKNFLGQKYRVAQCFVYHLNADGKIDVMRQYLDTGSLWAQLK
ncbi:MAG TPA: nuclear transport factor 2 family protein [Candidatus Saccharimonadales bacterium]|nr:nuclear transport factor 2 family protein [Candidatus Saccharimonadales bacterium]